MKLLLDTHILIWALTEEQKLSESIYNLISDPSNEVFYSTASVWELTIKHMAKPDIMLLSGIDLADMCEKIGFKMLPIENKHVGYLETLHRDPNAKPHHDPFDRILLSQAKAEGMIFITHDALIPAYNEENVLFV